MAGDFVGTKHCYQVVEEVLYCFCYSNRQDEHQGEADFDLQGLQVGVDPVDPANWVAVGSDRVESSQDSGFDCSNFVVEIGHYRLHSATGSSPYC